MAKGCGRLGTCSHACRVGGQGKHQAQGGHTRGCKLHLNIGAEHKQNAGQRLLYVEQMSGWCGHTLLRALLLLLVEGFEESLSSRSLSNAPVAEEAPVTDEEAVRAQKEEHAEQALQARPLRTLMWGGSGPHLCTSSVRQQICQS